MKFSNFRSDSLALRKWESSTRFETFFDFLPWVKFMPLVSSHRIVKRWQQNNSRKKICVKIILLAHSTTNRQILLYCCKVPGHNWALRDFFPYAVHSKRSILFQFYRWNMVQENLISHLVNQTLNGNLCVTFSRIFGLRGWFKWITTTKKNVTREAEKKYVIMQFFMPIFWNETKLSSPFWTPCARIARIFFRGAFF